MGNGHISFCVCVKLWCAGSIYCFFFLAILLFPFQHAGEAKFSPLVCGWKPLCVFAFYFSWGGGIPKGDCPVCLFRKRTLVS